MSDDYRLLITGSRKVTPEMLAYAEKAVVRAKELGWHIIVGDAAGVDEMVIKACKFYRVPCICFGITAKARHGDPLRYVRCKGDYPARDRIMGDICHQVLAIWNGIPGRSGTLLTYSYTKGLGKPGHLVNFSKPAEERISQNGR